jgi:hypothetical protein
MHGRRLIDLSGREDAHRRELGDLLAPQARAAPPGGLRQAHVGGPQARSHREDLPAR